MNIWIINHYAIPPSMGGLSRHCYFSKYLTQKGHSVMIFTSARIHNTDINMIADGKLFERKNIDGADYVFIKNSSYSGNGIKRIFNLLDFIPNLKKSCAHLDAPDVIYTSSPDLFTALSAVRMARRMRVPAVVEIRDLWPESIVEHRGNSRKNPAIRVLYLLEKHLYQRADRLIFTMPLGGQYVSDRGWNRQIDLSKIANINNGVDLAEFDSNKNDYRVSDEWLDDEGLFKAVYAGSIRQANGVGTLIEAAKLVLKENHRIGFLIYGEGTERAELEQKIKEEGIDNVRFYGQVNKKYLPYILSKCNLNLLHYHACGIWKYGGSQNKLFEYFASGRPVLSNVRTGGDLIEQYGAGISLEHSDARSIADAILRFAKMDKKTYDQYCRNALRAAADFDYNILGEKLETLLKDVCGK